MWRPRFTRSSRIAVGLMVGVALLAGVAAACGGDDDEVPVTTTPAAEEPETPAATPPAADEPATPPAADEPETPAATPPAADEPETPAATAPAAEPAEEEPELMTGEITVGVMNVFTGFAAVFGPIIEGTLDLVADDINAAGGIRVGDTVYTLKFLNYDTGWDPEMTVIAASQAVDRDEVDFIYNSVGFIAPSVQSVIGDREILILCVCEGGSGYLLEEEPLTFKLLWSIPDNGIAGLRYLNDSGSGISRVALLSTEGADAREDARILVPAVEELGFDVVSNSFVALGTDDYYPALTGILDGDPEVIVTNGTVTSTITLIVRQARELGYEGIFLLNDGLDLFTFIEAGLVDELEGSLAVPEFTIPEDRLADVIDAVGEQPPSFLTLVYDVGLLLAAAIEDAQSLDSVAVADALEDLSLDGWSGPGLHFADPYGRWGANRDIVFPEAPVALIGSGGEYEIVAR